MGAEDLRLRRINHALERDHQHFQETSERVMDATLRDVDLSIALSGLAKLTIIGVQMGVHSLERRVIRKLG